MVELLKPDLCVIGAGAGGLSVASAAASFGAQVVLVERGRMGGSSLNVGSVPSKALIAAARRPHAMAQAHRFGLDIEGGVLDFARVREHLREVIAAIAPNKSKERYIGLGVRVIEGSAKFVDARTVAVGEGIRIRARRFVIATGSSPALPSIEGLDTTPHLTDETVFDLDHCPGHLVVIGAGTVGLELAQAFRRLGAEVTVLEAAEPLAREDAECVQIVIDALAREGIAFRVGVAVARVGESQAGETPPPERQSAVAQAGEVQPGGMQAADVQTAAALASETQQAEALVDDGHSNKTLAVDIQHSASSSHVAVKQSIDAKTSEVQAGETQSAVAQLTEAPSGEARADETRLAPVQVSEEQLEIPLTSSQASEPQAEGTHVAAVQGGGAQSSAALLPGVQVVAVQIDETQVEGTRGERTQGDEAQVGEVLIAEVKVGEAPAEEIRSEPVRSVEPQIIEAPPNEQQSDEPQVRKGQPSSPRSWLQVTITGTGGEETIAGSHILVATGRRPNLDGLGLEVARIKYEPRGILVDKRLRTTNKRVYAIGDVTGGVLFDHAARYHAGLVVRNALFGVPVRVDEDAIPRVIFTDPELAQVGLTEEQARSRGHAICVLRWPYHENDRAQAERTTMGHIKVITSKRGRILGATIVGASAGELITTWALAISHKLNIRDFAGIVVPYPTLAEVGMRAAMTYFIPRLTSPWVRRIMTVLRLLR
jgi:pyruvate/2-oxoglutarate dehydrogenase complex dihydrolipoamide dehydrogenase (E3) component